MSRELMEAGEDTEGDVGETESKPFLGQEGSWHCWLNPCVAFIHHAGNSTKRDSPCDFMLASNCAPIILASDGKVDEHGEVLFDISCEVGVERSRHLYNLLPAAC